MRLSWFLSAEVCGPSYFSSLCSEQFQPSPFLDAQPKSIEPVSAHNFGEVQTGDHLALNFPSALQTSLFYFLNISELSMRLCLL